jgi:CO/xanthine dehydrogenase FAD-binding subunit
MITIDEYVKPRSVIEAYNLLTSRENAAVVGGGVFMRLASRKIGLAIDISEAGLDFIREIDDTIEIGAMTTFGELGRSVVLQKNLDGLIPNTVANIPGVQLRNMVSVGGTVYGRYGFSEFITCLMVLDCKVFLHNKGELSLNDFLTGKSNNKDILEKLIIKKQEIRASYKMFRNSFGSLPILTAAVSKSGIDYKIAVGGRPGMAALAHEAMKYLGTCEINKQTAEKAADIVSSELGFTNDRRSSAEYRIELCKVLVKRAIMEVQR